MAEAFLFNVAQSLIGKLGSPAYEAATQLIGVYDDLQDFKHTLSYVKAVLLDAEQKQEQNHALREWLKQIKRVFSDAEIVLDELECEILRKQVVKTYGTTKHKVGRFFSSSNSLVFRYKMSKKLEEIKKRLDQVAADRNKFGLERIDDDRRVVHRREMTYSHVVESNAIGRDFDKEKVIKLLLQENPCGHDDNKHISVIPIVGIGGMGKTTLAKLVYNDQRITESFPLKMWICVSDDFDIKQLMIKIIMCASEVDLASSYSPVGQQNVKDLDVQQLQHTLRKEIAGEKFLLVLDDVWNDDRVKWLELRDLVEMMGSNESKILVTTRSPTIASMMGTVSSYNLEGLSLKDSLSLFVRWAFKEREEKKYPNLANIAREIVKKCRGVPLAVRTLGSSLFSKHKIDEWENVRDNEIWNLSQKENDILPVLKLSYDQMPSYLKHCFAMFSLFPKDYVFLSATVSSLWGALGLLPSSKENKSLEDIANQYLLELMSKSFLHDFIDFGAGYCFKIHDLMHDLAIYVAKDQCVCVNFNIQNMPEDVQHLSFLVKHMLDKSHIPESATVRTILFPVHGIGIDEAFLNTSVLKHKYLYMLDLSNSTYETLPWFIHKLKHLRFLDMQYNRKVKRLPDSICVLQCLQTFLLTGCTELEVLPRGLEKLISLRRLEITTKQISLPEKEIANLNFLQRLHISFSENLESLFLGIKLPTLKTLIVGKCSNLKFLTIDPKHFPQLEYIHINGCDKLEFPEEYECGTKDSNMRLKCIWLESLPQLVTLPPWVQSSTNTLHTLIIRGCINFEVFPKWLSSLICLNRLRICDCPKLMSLPNDFHCLTALERLVIVNCPRLCRKCVAGVGEYWPRISHIKEVIIDQPEHFRSAVAIAND